MTHTLPRVKTKTTTTTTNNKQQKPLLTCLGYLALLLIGDTHKKQIMNVKN